MATLLNASNDNRISFRTLPNMVKALPVMAIFKVILSLIFFTVFTLKSGSTAGFPLIILYTSLAYAALTIPLFFFLHKRNIWAVRATLIVDFLISLPASAYIGFVISLVSLGLTFAPKVRAWFTE